MSGHAECRRTEQRLREANRRLQAEGPALERDKVIVALQAEIERLKSDHHAMGRWPDCKFCVSMYNQDEAGALENSRLRTLLSEALPHFNGGSDLREEIRTFLSGEGSDSMKGEK